MAQGRGEAPVAATRAAQEKAARARNVEAAGDVEKEKGRGGEKEATRADEATGATEATRSVEATGATEATRRASASGRAP